MYNPNSANDMKKLRAGMRWSLDQLEPFRKTRRAAIKEFVGQHYGHDHTDDPVPINLLEQAVNIYVQSLAPQAPQALVTAERRPLLPFAATMELAVNEVIARIEFEESLQEIVEDALFMMGIAKLGITEADREVPNYTEASGSMHGYKHPANFPFVDPVDLDDFVFDCSVSRWDQCAFIGNRYMLPQDMVMESKWLTVKAKKRLKDDSARRHNESGDQRVSGMGREDEAYDEFRDFYEFYDIWDPVGRRVLTLQLDAQGPALKTVDWDGPEQGPYRTLSFVKVPNNIMPLPPVATWLDLHLLANTLLRKLKGQAERSKTVGGYRGDTGAPDAENITNAGDGDMVKMMNPDHVKEFKFGGIDPQTLAFLMNVRDTFSSQAGNLDLLGGLSPMSGTAAQDELLSGTAARRPASMQRKTVKFTRKLVEDLAYYLWTDPLIELNVPKKDSQGMAQVMATFAPELRQGRFPEYAIDIDPYSMQAQTPESKLQVVTSMFNNVIMQIQDKLAEQGLAVDYRKYIQTIAKLTGVEEVDQLVVAYDTPEGSLTGDSKPGKPAMTHRISERISRPSSTNQGKNRALLQSMLGGGANDDELAALSRSAG